MRRTTTTVALVAAILLALLTAGAVLAATIMGTKGDDIGLYGTDGPDKIYGKGGDDWIGRAPWNCEGWGCSQSRDTTEDDPGADTYYGGPGKDVLDARGSGAASVDTLDCGEGGADLASFDRGRATNSETTVFDKVKENCERRDWTDKELKDCTYKPWDNADVKCKVGTNRRDVLLGKDDPIPE